MNPLIVHDYLLQRGGAERVVDELMRIFPQASLATSIISSTYRNRYSERKIITSHLQSLPVSERTFRVLLPFYAHAFLSLDLPPADVVICSSSGWAHHVSRRSDVPVLVYCHTPARWLWRQDEYFRGATSRALRPLLLPFLARLRREDVKSARAADAYVANSATVADRIRRFYGIEAPVVYPPVDVERFQAGRERQDFYLVVSRLLEYKRVDLAVGACAQLGRRLLVVGTGPALARLRRKAPKTTLFLGWQTEDEVVRLMETCRALLFPGEEDFGIAPVEAMAAGAPVVGFNAGGARETIVPMRTGILFERQQVEDVVAALEQVEARTWSAAEIAAHARRFDTVRFGEVIRAALQRLVA